MTEGKGYSIVDGERWDWEKGDLVLLPMKPGGVEHQHFNLDDKPSVWAAFINTPIQEHVASDLQQPRSRPTSRKANRAAPHTNTGRKENNVNG